MKTKIKLTIALALLMCLFSSLTVFASTVSYNAQKFPEKYASQRQKVVELLNAYDQKTLESHKVVVKGGKLKETLDKAEAIYYGEMKNNYANGFGIVKDGGEIVFCGEFKKGKPSGYGIVFESNDHSKTHIYEGDNCKLDKFLNVTICFKASGDGFIYDDNGDYYLFTDGPHIIYEGELDKNVRNGKGKEYKYLFDSPNGYGPLIYDGKFKDDAYSGKGVLYYEDGTVKYEGEFSKGLYNGKGTLYNADGSVKHKGKFKKGDIK